MLARLVRRKVVHTLVVLVTVSVLITLMLDLAPGDPAAAILGENASPESTATLRAQLGLDRSFLARYWDWASGVVRGDLGTGYFTRAPVLGSITKVLPVTAEIIGLTLLLALAISVPTAVLAAQRVGNRLDRAVMVWISFLQAAPAFVSAPFFVLLFVLKLSWLPATGWVPLAQDPVENLRHIVLPCTVLALSITPVFVAALRSDLITTLQQDFILNARAKGLSERAVLLRHALRPSSLSLVTMLGIALGQLVSGAVIVEVLFSMPGLGSLMADATVRKDIPLVQGSVMFIAALYVGVNLLIDVAYGVLDPRIRMTGGAR